MESIHGLEITYTERITQGIAQVRGSTDGAYSFITFLVCPTQTVNVRQGPSFVHLFIVLGTKSLNK